MSTCHVLRPRKPVRSPTGFPSLLDELTRAVLTYQPPDVTLFLAQYTNSRLVLREQEKLRAQEEESRINEFIRKLRMEKGLEGYASKIVAAFKSALQRRREKQEARGLERADSANSWEWLLRFNETVLTEEEVLKLIDTLESGVDDAIAYISRLQAATIFKHGYRLPRNVVAVDYVLQIRPRLDEGTFEGEVGIAMFVEDTSPEIVLNSVDLEIYPGSFWRDVHGNAIPASGVHFDQEKETVAFHFHTPIEKGCGTLNIQFQGRIRDDMTGFYIAKSENEKDRKIAVTLFEPTDARKCFPCLDEPDRKATFDISLIVPKHLTTISNTVLRSEKPYQEEEGIVIRKFDTTPYMSTYLVAIAVGEFDYLEDVTEGGVVCRVYTPPGKASEGTFALSVLTKALPFFASYFSVDYTFPKLDLVTTPQMYVSGMENWGLIIAHEDSILFNEQGSSKHLQQWIALLVCHEVCHQWFGNLVTMSWWTDLWLNEGFATFFEVVTASILFPEFELWPQFITEEMANSLEMDSLADSHPIEVELEDPKDIANVFDAISYGKGACIIRMLHGFMGDPSFRSGITSFLSEFKYRNASTEDLWTAFEKDSAGSSDKGTISIERMMNTWTKQKGFPMITVKIFEVNIDKEGGGKLLEFRQERFSYQSVDEDEESLRENPGEDDEGPPVEALWIVPLTFSEASNPDRIVAEYLLDKKEGSLFIEGVTRDDWIKVNPLRTGFYRVLYETEIMEGFIEDIRAAEMPGIDRLSLVDDLFAFTKAGLRDTPSLLHFLKAYRDDEDLAVWRTVKNILEDLRIIVEDTEAEKRFNAFAISIVDLIHAKLDWDEKPDESHADHMLRFLVISLLTRCGDLKATTEGRTRLQQFFQGGISIPPDLKYTLFNSAFHFLSQEEDGEEEEEEDNSPFEKMLEVFKTSENFEEKSILSKALGTVRNKDLKQQVLELSISPELSEELTFSFISGVASSGPAGRELAWSFLKEKMPLLVTRFSGGRLSLLGDCIKDCVGTFSSEEAALEVEIFFTENPVPGLERFVSQTLESIRIYAGWKTRDFTAIVEYLRGLHLLDAFTRMSMKN